jgi:hypothetical protein
MDRNRYLALIACTAVAASLPAQNGAKLAELAQRCVHQDDAAEAIALANRFGHVTHTPADLEVVRDAVMELCYSLVDVARTTADPAPAAAAIVAACLRLEQRHAGASLGATFHAVATDAAWFAGDLQQLAKWAQLALQEAKDPLDLTTVQILRARMHTACGRITTAESAWSEARKHFVNVDEKYRDQATQLLGLSGCDIAMAADDYESAHERLALLADGDPFRALYGNIITLGEGESHSDAEAELLVTAASEDMPKSVRCFAVAKTAQAALLRRDAATARQRLQLLDALSPIEANEGDGRSTALAIEAELLAAPAVPGVDVLETGRRAFAKLLAARRAAPAFAGGSGFLHLDDRATLVAGLMLLEQRRSPADGGSRALDHLLAAHAALLPPAMAETPVKAVLGALLGQKRLLLAYVVGRFRSVLLVAEPGAPAEIHELPRARELRTAATALHAAIGDELVGGKGAHDRRIAAAAAMAKMLLPPTVATRLAAAKGLIVTGTSMLRVPFEVLPQVATQQLLGESLPIVYCANLRRDALRATTRKAEHELLFVGTLGAGAMGKQPMKFRTELAQACAGPYAAGGGSTMQLLDERATITAVLAAMTKARVVHMAAHGTQDWTRDYPTGIALAPSVDGATLTGEALDQLRLDGAIAIVSACRAGDAVSRRGEDPLAASLAGAMLAAGARCVLVPLVDITSGPHLECMARCHAAIAKGVSPAVALWQVRQKPVKSAAHRLELLLVQVHGRGF